MKLIRSFSQRLKTRRPLERTLSLDDQKQLEIFVSCQDLKIKALFPKHLPSVALYIERDGVYELKGKTKEEKKNISNPSFTESFAVNYVSSLEQNLKFLVLATDQGGSERILGTVCMTLNSFLEKDESTAVFDIIKGTHQNHQKVGRMTLKTDYIAPTFNLTNMTVRIENIKKPKNILFNKGCKNLSLQLLRSMGNDGDYVPVYESEIKKCQTLECDVEIEVQKLCNDDHDKLIKLLLLEHTSSETFSVAGESTFTLNDLIDKKETGYSTGLICPENKTFCGIVSISEFEIVENPHFYDYINAGLRLNLLLGIDYTISNGDPKTTESLHSLKLEGPNEYEKAIKGVFESLLVYSEDKKVRMFGFGGKEISSESESDSDRMSHCFPLMARDNRIHATGLDGVLQVYRDSLKKVEFGSPSYLEPLIHQGRKIAKYLQNNEKNEYVVLTILTDGKCHDMADTINKIVEVSAFPLSIIIIGLGNSDFSKMQILGGANGLLDKRGNRSQRNIVHFVQFRKFQNSPILLGRNILEKVADQVLEYMFTHMLLPNDIRKSKEESLEDNLEMFSSDSEIEEDSCEEEKNKNISSFSRNQVKMNTAFFKTFESTTASSCGDDLYGEERSESISSFFSRQGQINPIFMKQSNPKKEYLVRERYIEERRTTFFKNNIVLRSGYLVKKEMLEFSFMQVNEQKDSIIKTTAYDGDAD